MKKHRKFFGLVLIILLVHQPGIADEPVVLVDSLKHRVFMSDEYTFYGMDLSKFVLVNKAKLHEGEKIKNEFFPAWLEKFGDKYTEQYLKSRLDVEILNDERLHFQVKQYFSRDPSSIVNYYSTPWSVDTLLSIVKNYQLERESGIGISYIIAEFNKEDEMVIAYVTFFDIETRELMFVVEGRGAATGMGMTNHWYYGLRVAWNDYFYMYFGRDKRKAIRAAEKAG